MKGQTDARAPLRAVPTGTAGKFDVMQAVQEVVGRLQLGRMALEWAKLVPFDALAALHRDCGICSLWDAGEEGREAAVWVAAEWARGQTLSFLAAGLAQMIDDAPSKSAIQRHFGGDSRKGRRPSPPHIGLTLALQRRKAERWMAEAVAKAEDEAARIPATFARVGELLVEQAGDALQAGDVVYERPVDIKVAVQVAMMLGAGKDTGGGIGALAVLGRMIEAMRRRGGDELVQSVMAEVAQMEERGSSTIAVGAARRRLEDEPVERMEEDGVLPSQRRRRDRPDDDQKEEEI